MTNVGKIYKPDLRRLAVAVSVQLLGAPVRARRRPCRRAAFSAKPVTLIVPFAGGSTTATCASWRRTHPVPGPARHRGKPAGAGGIAAGQHGDRLPDGYTISLYTLAMRCAPMHKTHWDPINDFTFLIGLSAIPSASPCAPILRTEPSTHRRAQGPRQHRLRLDRRGSSPHLLMEEVRATPASS